MLLNIVWNLARASKLTIGMPNSHMRNTSSLTATHFSFKRFLSE
ncbi:hypothetical protein HMPREF9554_01655 [Treponema phagedenis F0421]|nr:hypothetical protein HMPREF9554_01655 [Treponema phagedenis F0421]